MNWDRAVLDALVAHRTGWLDDVARLAADVGFTVPTCLAALLLCVAYGAVFRQWRVAAAAPIAGIVAVVAAEFLKQVIGRPRPPHGLALVAAEGFGMPSSVAAMTAAASVPVVIAGLRMRNLIGRALVWILVLANLGVGLGMVYLAAHWLSDVLAGWAFGVGVGLLTFRVIVGPLWRDAGTAPRAATPAPGR